MKKQEKQSPDSTADARLVEALREAYAPEDLPPLRRARIRARVRSRVANAEPAAPRSGWGLVPAAAALAGVLVAVLALVSAQRPSAPSADDALVEAILLDQDVLLASGLLEQGPQPAPLPADYQAIASLLGGPA